MPDPTYRKGLCGRYCNVTWICDPCQELSNDTAAEIDEMLLHIPAHKDICSRTYVDTYRISVAIVNKMTAHRGNQKEDAKYFATYLREKKWNFETRNCGNNVVIFLSIGDRQVYTSAGEAAFKVLTTKCINRIYKKATKDFFADDKFGGGLKFIIQEYKKALKNGTCDDSKEWIWVLVGSLVGALTIVSISVLVLRYRCNGGWSGGIVSGGGGGAEAGWWWRGWRGWRRRRRRGRWLLMKQLSNYKL
ncbi:Hypothetical predicted protein [Mytilus galloprovincialis]|nr:Hypothetical predicted protein [Mytilus galloprovincialis]